MYGMTLSRLTRPELGGEFGEQTDHFSIEGWDVIGLRLVSRLPSTTCAPAFRRSVLTEGQEVIRRPAGPATAPMRTSNTALRA
jgi:hypothetical protein